MGLHLPASQGGNVVATKTKLTYEDYETFPEDGNRYEIMDGEVFVTASPSTAHFVLENDAFVPFAVAHLDDEIRSRVLPDLNVRTSTLFRPRW